MQILSGLCQLTCGLENIPAQELLLCGHIYGKCAVMNRRLEGGLLPWPILPQLLCLA